MQDELIITHLEESKGGSFLDNSIKRILSHKVLLAFIIQNIVAELKEFSLDEIIPLMGDVKVSIDGKLITNPLITKGNCESKVKDGGTIFYDIIFDLTHPTLKKIGFVINIEAQRNYKDVLEIITRAVYYCGRMVSEQKGRLFHHQEYKDMAKVYSIWIMKDYTERESSIRLIKLQEDTNSKFVHKGKEYCYDYINIALIKLGQRYKSSDKLLDLLGRLLSEDNDIEDKLDAWQENLELDARKDAIFDKELRSMCNWSEGLIEHYKEVFLEEGLTQGISQGLTQGISQGIDKEKQDSIIRMFEKNMDLNDIAQISLCSMDRVKTIIEEYKKVTEAVN